MLWCAQQRYRQAAILPETIQIKARNAMTHTTAFPYVLLYIADHFVCLLCEQVLFQGDGGVKHETNLHGFTGFLRTLLSTPCNKLLIGKSFHSLTKMPFYVLWRCRQTQKISAWLHFAIERHFALKDDCLRYHPSNVKLYQEVSKGCLVSRGSIHFPLWVYHHKNSRMF